MLFFHSGLWICDDGYECSLFFYRLSAYQRHGDAGPKRVGAGKTSMSPGEQQICSGHATPSRPSGVAAPHDVDSFYFYDVLTCINQFFSV